MTPRPAALSQAAGQSSLVAAAEDVPRHVLMLDDDPGLCNLVRDYLGQNEFRVSIVDSGKQMLEVIGREPVDLLLLDLKLPAEDGLRLAQTVRKSSPIPIVILTGRIDEADRVMGLELGADDYVTKPFSPRELLARIRSVLRRAQLDGAARGRDQTVRAYRFEQWELNVRLHRLRASDARRIEISRGEFSLLCAFLSAPHRILTRDQLLTLSRLHSTEVYDRSIDVQILRLRRKIEADPGRPRYIKTERGVGYYFDVPVTVVR
jgi:two-component system, OmpR family, response regulator